MLLKTFPEGQWGGYSPSEITPTSFPAKADSSQDVAINQQWEITAFSNLLLWSVSVGTEINSTAIITKMTTILRR